MKASVISEWSQVIVNLLTAFAIVIAAIASARLRLFAGRPEISIEKRALKARTGESEKVVVESILIAVKVKNTGRMRIRTDTCNVFLLPLSSPQQDQTGVIATGTFALESSTEQREAKMYHLFRDVISFEPNEEVQDGLTLSLAGEYDFLKVVVVLVGFHGWSRRKLGQWRVSQILDLFEDRPSGEGA